MPSIQSFTMTCEEVNDYGTFSEGDTVRGKLTLALLKETAVDSFFVKLKGDANVRWSEKSGDKTRTYSARRRYFKLKHSIVDEESPNKVIHQGTHVYEFCFTIPTGSLPSTYRGSHGKIIYMVEAKLSRSWKMTRTLERELKLVSKAIPYQQSLMSQQFGSTDKEMGFFSKGKVHMDVTVDRQGYAPGDTVAVVAKINNASSRDMAPKFSLVQNVSYRAEGHSKHERNIIYKQIDELMRPNTDKTAVCAVKIPHDVVPTILNCEILSLEYYVKVYLDISFASDPEVLFPVIICHPELISNRHSGGPGGPYSSSNFGRPIKSNFPSSALATGQPPAGAFGGSPNHVMYGPTPANGTQPNGYYGAHSYSPSRYSAQSAYQPNPAQRLPRYGDPYTAPSSTLHPPPSVSGYVPPPSAPEISTIPPSIPSAPLYNFQPSAPLMDANFLSQTDEPPPSYSLLFPDFATDKSNAN